MASSSVQVNMEHSYGCAVRDSDGATFLHAKRLRELKLKTFGVNQTSNLLITDVCDLKIVIGF